MALLRLLEVLEQLDWKALNRQVHEEEIVDEGGGENARREHKGGGIGAQAHFGRPAQVHQRGAQSNERASDGG